MTELVVVYFLGCLLLAALTADLLIDLLCTGAVLRDGPPVPGVNWLGASFGALALAAPVGVLLALIFAINPFSSEGEWLWILVGTFLLAGAVGAVVDVPLSVWRNWREQQSRRRAAIEVAALGLLATFLICLFLAAYHEATRPRPHSWGAPA